MPGIIPRDNVRRKRLGGAVYGIDRRAQHQPGPPAMKSLFVSGALFLAFSVTSFARIGETMAEAVKRYGKVVGHDTIRGEQFYAFEKNGFRILVHFQDGKIDRTLYNSESRAKLTHEEIVRHQGPDPRTQKGRA
jgi:hypothetical protein